MLSVEERGKQTPGDPFGVLHCAGLVVAEQQSGKYLGLARTIYLYGVHTVFLAWKSPNIRCIYTYIYDSGQTYKYQMLETSIQVCRAGVIGKQALLRPPIPA